MDAVKAGLEKTLEAINIKTANENSAKASDPNVKPSERMDAAFEAHQATAKAAEHHAKAEEYQCKHSTQNNRYTIKMDAINAGIEKVKEACKQKEASEKTAKIGDPNVKPSERMDAEFEANKAAAEAAEHHAKAEEYTTKHVNK